MPHITLSWGAIILNSVLKIIRPAVILGHFEFCRTLSEEDGVSSNNSVIWLILHFFGVL